MNPFDNWRDAVRFAATLLLFSLAIMPAMVLGALIAKVVCEWLGL